MGCTEAKKAECRATGRVCNPKSGQCKIAESDKKKKSSGRKSSGRKSAGRKTGGKRVIPTSLVAQAVMANVGTATMGSLQKGRSRKLGAGMGTMIEKTRRAAGAASGGSGGCKPCPATRPIQDKATCKCYKEGSAAGRKAGICPPKMVKGRIVHYVYATTPSGQQRCLKAGGPTAKALLGKAACPPGKVMVRYQARVPASKMPGSRMKAVTASRCVNPTGRYSSLKSCTTDKVLAMVPTKAGPQRRCVLPKTAAAKGYSVVRQGDQAPLPFRGGRSGYRAPMSFASRQAGFPKRATKKKRATRK